jgi:hypothetical protein
MSDSLDDLAAFLMHQTSESDLTEEERLRIFALVGAYQEGDAPAEIESAMRAAAVRYADQPGFQPEWRLAGDEG